MCHVSAAILFASAPHRKQGREASSLAKERENPEPSVSLPGRHTELRRGKRWAVEGGRVGEKKKNQGNKTDKVVLLCDFRYSTPLQAVDIINISAAFPQRRPLSRLGVLIVSLAGRHWEALVRKLAGKLELLSILHHP